MEKRHKSAFGNPPFKNQPLEKAEAKELKENWPLANFVSAEPKYLKEKPNL